VERLDSDVPGQELCDAIHRMIGDLLEHDVQIHLVPGQAA
jgi:hypothetical protein